MQKWRTYNYLQKQNVGSIVWVELLAKEVRRHEQKNVCKKCVKHIYAPAIFVAILLGAVLSFTTWNTIIYATSAENTWIVAQILAEHQLEVSAIAFTLPCAVILILAHLQCTKRKGEGKCQGCN